MPVIVELKCLIYVPVACVLAGKSAVFMHMYTYVRVLIYMCVYGRVIYVL
jgi:hypothetical protein